MKTLIASCARLFKTEAGDYYTPVVYGYDFYKRYLNVFEEIIIAGFCDEVEETKIEGMIKVNGPRVSFFDLPYPHGEWEYIRKRSLIKKIIAKQLPDCDLMILRVPDTLCFLLMEKAIKEKMVFGLEVTSDPLNLYTRKTSKSRYHLIYKYYYYYKLHRACRLANGTSYVNRVQLQKHYPPCLKEGHFTTHYTNANVSVPDGIQDRSLPENRTVRFIHVSVSIGGFKKGHKEAVQTINELISNGYNVELALVGSGQLDPVIQEIIDKNGINNYIIQLGRLNPNQVLEELDKADVFLFPSYNEGLPRVVIEAMSRGLPVIASDIPAHRELIDSQFLAPVEDYKGLYKCAKMLLESADMYKRVSKRNLDYARENYEVSIIEKKRNEYYQKLKECAENDGKA